MKNAIYFALAVLIILTISVPTIAAPTIDANTFSCADVTEIPPAECEALVALYNSTNGAGWWDRTNWLVTNTISSWYGVTVLSGHVSELVLDQNHLTGSLPTELGNLPNLGILYLDKNQLSGSLPPEMGNLTNLVALQLYENQLSGSIPPELGNLTHLIIIGLEDNQLGGGIPAEMGNLSGLRYLFLDNNQLVGSIPPELGNLVYLSELHLFRNRLTGNIPPELGNLINLTWLYLSNNQLNGSIPPELGSLGKLYYLNLDGNALSGSIPPELGNMAILMDLVLNDNQLSGSIPSELGNLTNLRWLYLNDNLLSGNIPVSLENCLKLGELNLTNNLLSGPIPAALGNLTNLSMLRLNNNHLEGGVPGTFLNLIRLLNPGGARDQGDGLDLDSNLLNVPLGYPDPNDPLQVLLSQKDPDWQLYQGFTQMIGAGGGELTSLDGRTDFIIPEGALITDTTFIFIPQPAPTHDSGTLAFAHNSFLLTAEDASGNPIITFNQPITATLTYTNSDLVAPEDTLGLYFWDTAASNWTDAVTTCPGGEYTINPDANNFSLPLCHLTEFGIFGTPLLIFMPLIHR